MLDFKQAMNDLVTRFVSDAQEIARRAALASLEQLRIEPISVLPSSTTPPVPTARGRRAGSSRPKRSTSALHELASQFVQFVKDHPGLRIEQINKQLGTTTKNLALPIRKLVASGDIVIEGQKRSTTYYVAKPPKRR